MTCELQKHVRKCFENGMSAVRPDSILRSLKGNDKDFLLHYYEAIFNYLLELLH